MSMDPLGRIFESPHSLVGRIPGPTRDLLEKSMDVEVVEEDDQRRGCRKGERQREDSRVLGGP